MPLRNLFRCLAAAIMSVAAAAPCQQPASPGQNDKLKVVLDRLDRTAAGFHSAQASFEWDQYQRVTDETDKQKGKVYFRRESRGIQMAASITEPPPIRNVLYVGGKVQLYQPNTDKLDVYDAGKSNDAVESFLVLGFGGSGRDMLSSYDVTYDSSEEVDGMPTDKLELVPKAAKVKGMFTRIELWIDSRGISIQQKLITPEGDYRLNHYSDIILDKKLPDSVFKIKTSGTTKIENH